MSFTYGSNLPYYSDASYGGFGQYVARTAVTPEFSRRLQMPNVTPVFLVTVDAFESMVVRDILSIKTHYLKLAQEPAAIIHNNGVELTQVSTLSVPSQGEWVYSSTPPAQVVFTSPGSRDISGGHFKVKHQLRFASEIKTFRGYFWGDRVMSAPNISHRIESDFDGVGQIGGGSITFNNGDGYFDLLSTLIWRGGTLKLELGFDTPEGAMDESDYQTVGTWDVMGHRLEQDRFTLELREKKSSLDQEIPREIYTREVYPSIENDNIGEVIPRAYGVHYGVTPTVINKAERRFKLAHHDIRSINGIKIRKSIEEVLFETVAAASFEVHSGAAHVANENRTVKNITFDGTDLTEVNSTESVVSTEGSWYAEAGLLYVRPPSGESISSGSYVATISQQIQAWQSADYATQDLHLAEFTLGSDWDREAEVSVDFSGRTHANGKLMVNGADIMADLLDWVGNISLDGPAFQLARRFWHLGYTQFGEERVMIAPCLLINEKKEALEVVTELNKVLGSFLYIDATGTWQFRAFLPTQGQAFDRAEGLLPRLFDDSEVIDGSFVRQVDSENVFARCKINFANRDAEGWSESIEEYRERNHLDYGLTDEFVEERDVCLSSKADAIYYAQRVLTTEALPRVNYQFRLPWKGLLLAPGDQIRVQTSRFVDSPLLLEPSDVILEILEVNQDLTEGQVTITAGDRRGWSDTFGHWLGETGTISPVGGGELPTNLAIHLAADQSGLVPNQHAAFWLDISGNERHATQPFPGNVAELKTNQLNGFPVVRFRPVAGSPSLILMPNLSFLNQGEVFAVVKTSADPASVGSYLWNMGNPATPPKYPNTSGVITENFGSNTTHTIGNITPDLSGWHIVNIISTPDEYTFNLDGTEEYTTGTNTVYFPGVGPIVVHVGGLLGSNLASDDREIAELFISPVKLTSTQRTAALQYLSDKYALAVVSAGGPPPAWDAAWTDAESHTARQNAGFWTDVGDSNVELAKDVDVRSHLASRWW